MNEKTNKTYANSHLYNNYEYISLILIIYTIYYTIEAIKQGRIKKQHLIPINK